jgi:hypothetical protein
MSQPPMPSGPPRQPLPQPQFQTWPLLGMPPDGSQPPYGPVPVQQPPKKPKRFGWPTVIITAVITLFVGMLFAFGGEPTPTAMPEATATVTETVTETETETENLPAEESSEPKTKEQDQPKIADTISDGIHEVGVDVKAGQYKTTVPERAFCYWERIRGDDISDSTSRYKEGPARQSVTIKKGDSFETEDCGTWKRAD